MMIWKKFKKQIESFSFLKLTAFLVCLFIFCVPFQLRSLIVRDSFFITGNLNIYDSFFFFAGDVILLLALISWGCCYIFRDLTWEIDFGDKVLSVLIMFFILNVAISVFIFPGQFGLFFALRLILLFLFYLLLNNNIIGRNRAIDVFCASMILQVLIAIMQFFLQASVGLHFLGEPILALGATGIAKMDLSGNIILRSYGTFLHPNILGGALFVGLFLAFYRYKNRIYFFAIISALLVFGSVLTFSRAAILGIVIAMLCLIAISESRELIKRILYVAVVFLFFIVLLNLQNVFWQRFILGDDGGSGGERISYLNISKQMIHDNPFGVGAGNFTNYMQNYTSAKLEPWDMQPVHNFYLLIANELGILGLISVLMIFFYLFFRCVYLAKKLKQGKNEKIYLFVIIALISGLLTMGVFDHFFYTSYQGQFMLFFIFYLAGDLLKKFEWPRIKS